MKPAARQSMQGNQGVQVGYAHDSTVTITYNNGATRAVPLERATVPVPADAKSPTSLIRARSGVVPFAARKGLRDALIAWLGTDAAFAGAVIGGAGGTGKTRLAVELCERAERENDEWLTGMLASIEDMGSLEALAEAPVPRLIAVDYAESRAEQMQVLLPLLALRATEEAPVRVLLLVRAGPKRTNDWAEALRNQSDRLDVLLDECEMHVLEDLPLEPGERTELFETAADVFARRNGATSPPPLPAALQRSGDFASPLMVVLAAYLAVHGDEAPPSTRTELLRAVIKHEERYWRSSAGELFADKTQPRQVIALATLLGAECQADAIERLRLLPDFGDAPAERLGLIARWAAERYPGTGWWNPLEPDLVGEQLVADEFSEQPAVLAGALDGETPKQLIRPLEVLGRAVANHPELVGPLQAILKAELRRLCEAAVKQAQEEADHDLIYGKAVTLSAVLEKAVRSIEVDPDAIASALAGIPSISNLVLNSLALTLSFRHVEHQRRLAQVGLAGEPDLAMALNDLSVHLGYAGRRGEGLVAIEECVEIYRRLATENPTVYEPDLAIALNNLSADLAAAGHRAEGLLAIEECVEIRRRLVAESPDAHEPDLAMALNNLSVHFGYAGRRVAGLTAIEECVEIRRRLVAESPDAHEPDLAMALNNLSPDLAAAGRGAEGLVASEECVEICRRLVADNPAGYEPDLAMALNNLSIRLEEAGRRTEGLLAIEECVEIRRRLVAENADAHEPDLAMALNNLSPDLAAAGRGAEGLVASEECVEICRRLVADNPAGYEPDLAMALNNLSTRLAEEGHPGEGLAAVEECVEIRRRLVAENADAHEPDLATALDNLSVRLGDVGRYAEGLAASEECVEIYGRLAAENPAVYEPYLTDALSNMSRLDHSATADPSTRVPPA